VGRVWYDTRKDWSLRKRLQVKEPMHQVKETPKNPRPGDGTPGPGRPKGVPNKTTGLLKDAILKAAETAGGGEPDGLVNYLVKQAKQNPGPFMTLLGKVLPTQVSGEEDKNLHITIRHVVEEARQLREPATIAVLPKLINGGSNGSGVG